MKKIRHRNLLSKNKETPSGYSKVIQYMISLFDDAYDKLEDLKGDARTRLLKQLNALDGKIYEEMLEEKEDELVNDSFEITQEAYQKAIEEAYANIVKIFPNVETNLKNKRQEASEIQTNNIKIEYSFISKKNANEYVLRTDVLGGDVALLYNIVMHLKNKTATVVERVWNEDYRNKYITEKELKVAEYEITPQVSYYLKTLSLNAWLQNLNKPQATKLTTPSSDEQILTQLKKAGITKGIHRPYLVALGVKTPLNKALIQIGKHTLRKVAFSLYHKYNLT